MPRNVIICAVHHITYGPGGIAFAEDTSYLPVGHHAADRDLPDNGVNAFAVVFVVNNTQVNLMGSVFGITNHK